MVLPAWFRLHGPARRPLLAGHHVAFSAAQARFSCHGTRAELPSRAPGTPIPPLAAPSSHGLRLHLFHFACVHRRPQVHRDRWVDALAQALESGAACLLIGPADPISGLHLVDHVRKVGGIWRPARCSPGAARADGGPQVIPAARRSDAKITVLGEGIGHWPLQEDPAGVVAALAACVPPE